MNWVLYGLLHSLFRAAFAETNRTFRAGGWYLTFWHALVGAVILLPLIPFMAWPQDDRFYFGVLIIAMIFSVGTVIQLTLASQGRGRVSGLSMPLEAAAAFVIWAVVGPGVAYYMDNPLLTGGVVLAFFIASIAMLRIRRHDINLETFIIVAPVGLTYAVSGVVIKMIIGPFGALPLALTFVFLNYAVTAVVMGFVLLVKRDISRKMIEPNQLKAGGLTGVFGTLALLTFVLSIVQAPNPGYTSMFAMLLPVWLWGVHRLIRLDDDAQPVAATAIAASMILMVVAVTVFG